MVRTGVGVVGEEDQKFTFGLVGLRRLSREMSRRQAV